MTALLSRPARNGALLGGAALTVGAAVGSLALIGVVLAPASALSTDLAGVACAVGGVQVSAQKGGYGLTSEQMTHAGTIIATGRSMGVPVKGHVIAIATALQESGLRNLDHGDRDSIGLFQQRPSQGWGTRDQIMNPSYSAQRFYSRLLKVRGWQDMSVTDAAQAVQRSGFPDAYAQHESRAVQIVASLHEGGLQAGIQQINASSGCSPVAAPASAQARGYVGVALQQVGKPYKWGATGPDSFDCSGLIVYAWRQMGYQLKVRTSQQMHDVAVPVEAGQEQPGDLIFTEFGGQGGMAGPAHVLIVVRPGVAVEAPRTGLDVRVRAYNPATENMRFGRLPRSQMDALALA